MREMNKEEKAISTLSEKLMDYDLLEYCIKELDVFRKLVDKATPMKPKNNSMYGDCPSCDLELSYEQNFCDRCGQKLDWGE